MLQVKKNYKNLKYSIQNGHFYVENISFGAESTQDNNEKRIRFLLNLKFVNY